MIAKKDSMRIIFVAAFFMGLAILMIMNNAGCAKKEEAPAPVAKQVQTKAPEVNAQPVPLAVVPPNLPERKGEQKIIYDFENDIGSWEIPDWTLEQQDYVAKSASLSKDAASASSSSLKVDAAFPGKVWTASLVEVMHYLDLGPYAEIACDIYIPADTPPGLKAKIIVTVGSDWKFTEMARAVPLVPGQWVTLNANLLPGSEDWKAAVVDDAFRRDVRKIAIRVESNKAPVYTGPIYIDNVRVSN